jgi:hypothetical protein
VVLRRRLALEVVAILAGAVRGVAVRDGLMGAAGARRLDGGAVAACLGDGFDGGRTRGVDVRAGGAFQAVRVGVDCMARSGSVCVLLFQAGVMLRAAHMAAVSSRWRGGDQVRTPSWAMPALRRSRLR